MMTTRVCTVASLLTAALLLFPFSSSLNAYPAGSTDGVVSVLLKKYTLTTTTFDKSQITHAGTQLSIQQAGIYSYPANGIFSVAESKVAEGKIKGPAMASFSCKSAHCHVLQSGEKLYVTKIEAKDDKDGDVLKFNVISFDDIDGGDGSQRYAATVTFKFKKNYLSESSPDDVEAAVEAVMAPGDDSSSAKTDTASTTTPAAQPPVAPVQRAPPPPAPVVPAAAPAELSVGETSSQVLQAYGMPTKIIDLGKKKTFIYKDIKIVFTDDKISDMQPQ